MIFKYLGFDIDRTISFFKGLPFYIKDFRKLKKQKGDNRDFVFANPIPILNERFSEAGTMSGQYFHQDLFVAQQIYKNNPEKHVDIGSRIDGFVAHVATFRKIEIFDIRKQESKIENIIFKQADLMSPLTSHDLENYCDSISCLHAIEHFGLGRYGDPVDYFGHLKALDNIYKIIKKGGTFYFSTPIGKQSIQFNAHRIFSTEYIFDLFKDRYQIKNFSYIDDNGDLVKNVEITEEKIKNNFDCRHGCAIFEMSKI